MGISRRQIFTSLIGAGAASIGQNAAAQAGKEPTVLSGQDIGFRVDSIGRNGVPLGGLVVRLGGQWVAPQFQSSLRKAT